MGLEWLSPGWIAALILVPVVLLLPRLGRSASAKTTGSQNGIHNVLRVLGLAALVLVLAEPVWISDKEDTHQVFVLDASESIDTGERSRAINAASAALAQAGEAAWLVGWGEQPEALSALSNVRWLGAASAGLDDALHMALTLIPAGAPAHVSAWTDGALRCALPDQIVSAFQLRGIALDIEPLTVRSDDFAVVDVWAPEPLRIGLSGRVIARVTGFGRVSGVLSVGENTWANIEDVAIDGTRDIEFEVEPDEAGFPLAEFGLTVLEGANAIADNDRIERTLPVQDPLDVLILTERLAGSVDQLSTLVGPGIRFTTGDPESLAPESHDLVVLDDLRAENLPTEMQELLVQSVTQAGVGLVVTGGEASFGPGGYHDTAIDSILPVESVQKEEKRDPSTTLVVIIDTSGSMGGNRVQLAKEVTRLAIRRLLPHDKVGIVEFYGAKRWAAPIQPASNSIEIQRALNRLDAGGGTVILPAIEEAFYGLQNVDTRYKHVLILTDGGVETGPFESLVRRMAEKGMNVSTVLVGPDSHSEFLVSIANWGKGRFYSVANRFNLPEVLLKQPTSARIPGWRPGSHTVRARGGQGWWGSADPTALPPLSGYTETKARAGSLVLAETVKAAHPVIATWQNGLGRVTAMPTELTGAATEAWNEWDGYGAFVARLLARTAQRDGGPFRFKLERRGHEVVLTAVRVERSERRPVALSALAPDIPLEFVERAPGTFVVRRVVDPGQAVTVTAGVEGSTRRERLAVDAYSDRAHELATDPALQLDVELLAQITGGVLLAPGAPRSAVPTGGTRARSLADLRPWLLALALLCYLLDIAWRRRPSTQIRS